MLHLAAKVGIFGVIVFGEEQGRELASPENIYYGKTFQVWFLKSAFILRRRFKQRRENTCMVRLPAPMFEL